MLTYYCPNCWEIIAEGQSSCPNCGYILNDFIKYDYDDKLIAALRHSVPERRIMAAQILGIRQCKRALPEFTKILESGEENYFFLRAVLLAVAKIDDPARKIILGKALHHPSRLVAHLAKDVLDGLENRRQPEEWDKSTG